MKANVRAQRKVCEQLRDEFNQAHADLRDRKAAAKEVANRFINAKANLDGIDRFASNATIRKAQEKVAAIESELDRANQDADEAMRRHNQLAGQLDGARANIATACVQRRGTRGDYRTTRLCRLPGTRANASRYACRFERPDGRRLQHPRRWAQAGHDPAFRGIGHMTWKIPASARKKRPAIHKRVCTFNLSEHAIELLDRLIRSQGLSNRTVVLENAIRDYAARCDDRLNLRNLLDDREKKIRNSDKNPDSLSL